MKVFLFALLAAVGNALFVYGQRGSSTSENPYFFILSTLLVCNVLYIVFALGHRAPMELAYLQENARLVVISGIGFFLTFVGFYLMYTQHGAASYIVYALLSILTTSIIVGLVIFREPFNKFHVISGCLAVGAILFYGLGQSKLSS